MKIAKEITLRLPARSGMVVLAITDDGVMHEARFVRQDSGVLIATLEDGEEIRFDTRRPDNLEVES